MNRDYNTNNRLFFGALCLSLLMIPGCWFSDLFKKNKTGQDIVLEQELAQNDVLLKEGEQLVCMNGICIMTDKSLDRDFEQLLDENPQLRSVIPLMPNAKENFMQGMISQAVVDRAVKDNKMHLSAEYQKEYAQLIKTVESRLNAKYFSAAYTVDITDADVDEYYETNKTKIPELVVSQGGIKAEGVSFDTHEAAKAFATAVKGKEFAKIAKDQKVDAKIQDFKLVNDQSIGMNGTIKATILGMTTFPATEVVKVDDRTYWVIHASEKQEPKYLPLEQVRAGLQQHMEKERRMAVLEREITRLKKEYNVTVNEEFFTKQNEQRKMATAAQIQEMKENDAYDAFDHVEPAAMNVA